MGRRTSSPQPPLTFQRLKWDRRRTRTFLTAQHAAVVTNKRWRRRRRKRNNGQHLWNFSISVCLSCSSFHEWIKSRNWNLFCMQTFIFIHLYAFLNYFESWTCAHAISWRIHLSKLCEIWEWEKKLHVSLFLSLLVTQVANTSANGVPPNAGRETDQGLAANHPLANRWWEALAAAARVAAAAAVTATEGFQPMVYCPTRRRSPTRVGRRLSTSPSRQTTVRGDARGRWLIARQCSHIVLQEIWSFLSETETTSSIWRLPAEPSL